MNLSQLNYFKKLAETQHYGRASEELFITQPSLSNSIAKLESELGVPLFERVGRRVRLTSFGIEFNKRIASALSEIDKAVDCMHAYSEELSGKITVGTVISIQSVFLPELLHHFRMKFGDSVDFDIHQETTYGCIDGVKEGRFDLAFCGKPASEKSLVFHPILSQNLVIAVDRSHPLAQEEMVSLEDIKQYSLVSYRSASFASTIIEGIADAYGLELKPSFNDEISGGALVAADKKVIGLMLETLQKDAIKDLVCVPIAEITPPSHIIHLVYRKSKVQSFAMEHMVKFALESSEF